MFRFYHYNRADHMKMSLIISVSLSISAVSVSPSHSTVGKRSCLPGELRTSSKGPAGPQRLNAVLKNSHLQRAAISLSNAYKF